MSDGYLGLGPTPSTYVGSNEEWNGTGALDAQTATSDLAGLDQELTTQREVGQVSPWDVELAWAWI